MMKGFKGFKQDLTCMGFQYEVGKTYQYEGEVRVCNRGFHFCKNVGDIEAFYSLRKSRICEIEADGIIKCADTQYACSKIRIVRELSKEEILAQANIGCNNTGLFNVGDENVGKENVGDWNVGSWNVGNGNVGDGNVGSWNVGDWNVGDGNVGSFNSGAICSCDNSSGIFMSRRISYEAFNKSLSANEYRLLKISEGFDILKRFKLYSFKARLLKENPKQRVYLSYKESWRMFWQTLTPKEKLAVKRMPHFDAQVFYEITGIKLGLSQKEVKNENAGSC